MWQKNVNCPGGLFTSKVRRVMMTQFRALNMCGGSTACDTVKTSSFGCRVMASLSWEGGIMQWKSKSKLFYSVDKCQRVNSLFHSVY
jgi:hypothetical protein